MTLLTKKELSELSDVHAANCISIFIPTHRGGQEVLEKKDALLLKNQLKEVSRNLEDQGHTEKEIDTILRPASQLLEDTEFWRHQSDGLALFISEGYFKKYTLPLDFEAGNYVSNSFYVIPLIPLLSGDGRYFILTLNLEGVRFYEGTRHSITPIVVEDLTPDRLQDVVGYDYEQKFLQFRTQQEGGGKAMFHGHGEGEADRRNEIKRYFRAVNDGLMKLLHDEQQPMIVASLDYLFPIYKEVNEYQHLMEKYVSGNPADEDLISLHDKTWGRVAPHFEKERKEKAAMYQQELGSKKASPDIRDIIPAAMDGRVDALFLRGGEDVFGLYDKQERQVELEAKDREAGVSLFNLVAVEAMEKGGKVYVLPGEEMPDSHSSICALFRY